MAGLDDLKGLFQTKWFYDSIRLPAVLFFFNRQAERVEICHNWPDDPCAVLGWGVGNLPESCTFVKNYFPLKECGFCPNLHTEKPEGVTWCSCICQNFWSLKDQLWDEGTTQFMSSAVSTAASGEKSLLLPGSLEQMLCMPPPCKNEHWVLG